jgi:NTE family protein
VGQLGDDAARALRAKTRYIQLMGHVVPTTVTRIIRQGEPGEPSSRDYDFSERAVERNQQEGYRLAREALEKVPR